MDKSYVTMEQKECILCGKHYDTGNLLMDNKLRNRFERFTCTGLGVCEEHRKEGYIVLIEIDPSKSDDKSVYKTGPIAHMKLEAFKRVFPNHSKGAKDFCFVDEKVMSQLRQENKSVEPANATL